MHLQDVEKYVLEAGRKCLLIQCDVGMKQDCVNAVDRCVRELGKIDCLINNAAVQYLENDLAEVTVEHLEETMRTNVHACFYLSQEGLLMSCATTATVHGCDGSGHKTGAYRSTKRVIVLFVMEVTIVKTMQR
jgi:NAD(P)-dependent dehydrogenase (short-subunit alcohol dehydrogenase family)